jgi:hypothetical protein
MNSLALRKILALTCAIFLVPSLVFALVTTNLEKSLFDPALYKQAMNSAQVYERLPDLVAEQMAANARQQDDFSAMLLGALPPGSLQRLFTSILRPETLQRLTEQGIDRTFDYVNGQSGDSVLGLGDIKQELAANSGGLVDQYFDTLPDCGLADMLNFAGGLLSQEGDLPQCNPPDAVREAVAVPLRSAVEEQLSQVLPDSLSLSGEGSGLQGLFTVLRWVRITAELTPLLALFFLGTVTLLAVRTAHELLRWWGWPLLIGGFIGLGAGLLVAPAVTGLLDLTLIAQVSQTLGPGFAALLSGVASAFAACLVRPIVLDALLVAVLGVGLLVAERFRPEEAAA